MNLGLINHKESFFAGIFFLGVNSNIQIIGVPGEEEEQEIENLFEKVMKENFPNLEKEIDFQEVQEAQRVPKTLDPRKNISRHHHH